VRRFKREIDADPEDIDERHIILRRIVLRKMQGMKECLRAWRLAV
jgi:hypothetical protein